MKALLDGDAQSTETAHTQSEDWPRLDEEEALYGLVGDVVRAIGPHTEADPVALLAHFLAQFSCIIGNSLSVNLDGSPNPLLFWPVLVGDTGKSRKGSAGKRIDRLFKGAFPDWTGGKMRGSLSSGEGLACAVRDGDGNDPEGILDKRLYLVQSEFGSMLKVMSREGNSLSGVIREAWDGEDLAPLTKGSPVRATRPHIVIVGHVTQEELVKHLSDTEKANGFANRFVWFAVHHSRVLPLGSNPDQAVLSPVTEHLRHAVKFAKDAGEVALSIDAANDWRKVYTNLSEGKPGIDGATLGRAEAQVRRIAALYALLDRQTEVAPMHLKAALAVWQYAEDSVAWVFAQATYPEIENKILRAVVKKGKLPDSDISALFNRNMPASQLEKAKAHLQEEGLIHDVKLATGGRPRIEWRPGPTPKKPVAP